MFYTFIWGSPHHDLPEQIPLESLCASVVDASAEKGILNIVFLEGMEYVPQTFLNGLPKTNVRLINYEESFAKIRERYKEIFRQFSKFESFCLLRWICLKELTKASNLQQVWHVDSDVVFHVPLKDIAEETKGKTFMLEGCPVLTSISKMEWFDIYEDHLQRLLRDIPGYSNWAAEQKTENSKRDKLICNQSLYRNPIGSDQDLLQFLIGSGLLPQDDASHIFSGNLFYVQNALQLNDWEEYQGVVGQGDFKTNELGIKANKRQLAFTHFQGNFVTYCNLFYFLNKLSIPKYFIRQILSFSIKDDKFTIGRIAYLIRVFINRTGISMNRSRLVKTFTADDNRYLLKMMNFLAKNEGNENTV